MKKFLITLAAFAVATLAFAAPAWAWHVADVTVECSEQDSVLTVFVSLSDDGPGTYSDSEGNAGSFGAFDSFAYELSTTPSSLTVNVVWATQETGSFTTEDFDQCQSPPTTTIPPTTTTAPPVTTSVPAPTTSTTPPYVTTPPELPAPSLPPALIATPELPNTGSTGVLAVIFVAGACLLLVGISTVRRGRS